MKHAYLIIAHNDFEMLKFLLQSLRDPRNDLYIHIDKKVKLLEKEVFAEFEKDKNLHVYREIDVRWGDESQVKCEVFLMKKALEDGYHDYYHIISGTDYPIKDLDTIDSFFEKNRGKEFVHFDSPIASQETLNRVYYYHPFSRYYKITKSRMIHKLFFVMDDICIEIQKKICVPRALPFKIIQKGCNWCSITHDLVQYIIFSENKIEELIKKSKCADEVFIQTVVINSGFAENLYRAKLDNDYKSCIRLIVWDEDNVRSPKTFSINDYDLLAGSEALFARKFSSEASEKLIRLLRRR